MPKIKIPSPLTRFTGDQRTVEVQGKTVKDALESLVGEHDQLKDHLFDAEGRLRSFVNVYLGEKDIRTLQGEETPVGEDDVLMIIPSIAGGRGRLRSIRDAGCLDHKAIEARCLLS